MVDFFLTIKTFNFGSQLRFAPNPISDLKMWDSDAMSLWDWHWGADTGEEHQRELRKLKNLVGEMAINPDRISAAQAKLAEDPHDVDSWVLLIKHCQCRSGLAWRNNVKVNLKSPLFLNLAWRQCHSGVLTRLGKRTKSWWQLFPRQAVIGKLILSRCWAETKSRAHHLSSWQIVQEIRARNYERVELLFQRCLIRVLSIELWKTYLLYVKVLLAVT